MYFTIYLLDVNVNNLLCGPVKTTLFIIHLCERVGGLRVQSSTLLPPFHIIYRFKKDVVHMKQGE